MNVQDISLPDSSDRRMKSSLAGNCADPLELCRVSSSAAQHNQVRQETTASLVTGHLIVIKYIGLKCHFVKTYVQICDSFVKAILLAEEEGEIKGCYLGAHCWHRVLLDSSGHISKALLTILQFTYR